MLVILKMIEWKLPKVKIFLPFFKIFLDTDEPRRNRLGPDEISFATILSTTVLYNCNAFLQNDCEIAIIPVRANFYPLEHFLLKLRGHASSAHLL